MRPIVLLSALAAIATLLSGCASVKTGQPRAAAPPPACDDATGQGLAFSPGHAKAIAETAAAEQVRDVRGYLLAGGLQRIRPRGRSVSCKPYQLGGGLVQCTVVRRLCGR